MPRERTETVEIRSSTRRRARCARWCGSGRSSCGFEPGRPDQDRHGGERAGAQHARATAAAAPCGSSCSTNGVRRGLRLDLRGPGSGHRRHRAGAQGRLHHRRRPGPRARRRAAAGRTSSRSSPRRARARGSRSRDGSELRCAPDATCPAGRRSAAVGEARRAGDHGRWRASGSTRPTRTTSRSSSPSSPPILARTRGRRAAVAPAPADGGWRGSSSSRSTRARAWRTWRRPARTATRPPARRAPAWARSRRMSDGSTSTPRPAGDGGVARFVRRRRGSAATPTGWMSAGVCRGRCRARSSAATPGR